MAAAPPADRPQLGRDPLDLPPPGVPLRRWRLLPSRRVALGLGESATPAFVFVVAGYLLGPQGTAIVSTQALAYLDTVVSVALAMLGVFVGLGLRRMHERPTRGALVAATVETSVTVAVVGSAMYVLFAQWDFEPITGAASFAAMLGLCSAASAALSVGPSTPRDESIAARIADLDDAPLVVGGAVVVAALAGAAALQAQVVGTIGTGVGVGVAGWLLFERADGDAERGVFVTGAIVMLGGLAAFLSASPLLAGCTAALLWVHAPGAADRIIAADLAKLQHPLVALLLLVAGASIENSAVLPWIAAPLIIVRLTGKLLGSAAAARLTAVPPGLIATVLVPPGVMGIAVALNIQQTIGSDDALLVSGVTVAAVVSELLGVLLLAGEAKTG